MSFKTPVLLLVFNRPDKTAILLERLKEISPSFLFVAADGPREGNVGDQRKCQSVKELIDNISWDCKVTTLYRTQNLGCRNAVSSGITWFFEQVEEGIILEDDILPDPSFFSFCEEMLTRYRSEKRIMNISGFNILNVGPEKGNSYHFCFFGTIWGWATWRRSWMLYDVKMLQWKVPDVKKFVLRKYFPKIYREDRKRLYDQVFNGEIDTWDYQWTFARLVAQGVSIVPSVNLIMNIGFDGDATHTSTMPKWVPHSSGQLVFPLRHPTAIKVNKLYDKKHLLLFKPRKLSVIKRYLKKLIKLF